MAKINFGGVVEEIVTRKEFPLKKALQVLKGETIAAEFQKIVAEYVVRRYG